VLKKVTVEVVLYAFHQRRKLELDVETSLPGFCGPFLSTLPYFNGLVPFAMNVVLLTRQA